MVKLLFACLSFASLITHTAPIPIKRSTSNSTLDTWPADIAAKLDKMIADNANTGSYACFDADQTTYQWDLEEAIVAFLEMKAVLTREKLPAELQLIPFLDDGTHRETIFSYYSRLCTAIDDSVCYTWIVQVFSGMTVRELKSHVDDMLQSNTGNTTIRATLTTMSNGSLAQTDIDVPIPRFYTAQRELYNRLMAHGIEVYVVSASHEELVRLVLADPKYGYNVKPQNVLGVATLLNNGSYWTSARKTIRDQTYDQTQQLDMRMSSFLWSPQTMFSGKYGAIMTYIDQWKMPVLVAGDTPLSDGYMLFHAYNQQRGTVRVWVNRKEAYLTQIKQMADQHAKSQQENGLPVTADKNWLYVTPSQLGATHTIDPNVTATTQSRSSTLENTTDSSGRNGGNSVWHHQYEFWMLFVCITVSLHGIGDGL